MTVRYIKGRFNKFFYCITRIIIIILVILSLSGTSILQYANTTTTIFAVDISDSTKDTSNTVLQLISQAEKNRGNKDSVGVVCFGKDAVVESMPTLTNVVTQLSSYVKGDYTNISEGLRLSQSIMPENSKKRITLISDGQENIDDALSQAKLLKEQGIVIDVLPIKNVIENEIQLSEIKIPKYIKKDTKYDIEVTAHSLFETSARLILYKNNEIISSEITNFKKGENKFIISDTTDKNGGIIYRAEILPDKDTFFENNVVYGYSYVEGAANILVVDNKGSSDEIINILSDSKVTIDKIPAESVPTTLEQLNNYDGIIMSNISLEDTPKGFADIVESYVKNSAGGLVVTGGDSSYALGEYKDTPLERVLPVDMEIKDKKELPDLGMVVVIDRSGSMTVGKYGVSKLELAKEALIRSVETLNEKDSIGVIAFDHEFTWISELQKIGGNINGIINSIANISPGGGTSILPGLYEAYDAVSKYDSKIKHIILLTDGQAETTGYDSLLEQMKSGGITLSTVAVGADSDYRLLESLAEKGNGRYYYSDEFSDLPKIFAKETYLAGRDFLNNEMFYPKTAYINPIMESIDAVPALKGYISTSAKDRADIVLTSPKDEPVLASWQYGLGKAVAWTSDAKGVWTDEWLGSQQGVTIFRNMVSWSLRKQMSSDINLSVKSNGETSEITVTIPYAEGVTGVSGNIVSSDIKQYDVEFTAVAPGKYVGILNEGKEGAYMANISIETYGDTEYITTGLSIPYSDEYDIRNFDKGENLLKRLAEVTGGRLLTSPDSLYTSKLSDVFGKNDISNLLLLIALILFILDIAIRRFPAISHNLETALIKVLAFNNNFSNKKESKHKYIKKSNKTTESDKTKTKITKQKTQKDNKKINVTSNTSNALISSKKKRSGR